VPEAGRARPTRSRRPTKTRTTTRIAAIAQQPGGERQGQERLRELDLGDARDAAERQPGVPGEEAEIHAHRPEVDEAAPGERRDVRGVVRAFRKTQYDSPIGYAPLRRQLAVRLGERGVAASPE
jgi:DNA-binding transcriptional MocR family regulator